MGKKFVLFLVCVTTIIFLVNGCNSGGIKQEGTNTTTVDREAKPSKEIRISLGLEKELGENDESIGTPEVNNENTNKTEIKKVKSRSKVIVIDAGHGGKITSDKEAISPNSKTMKPKNVSGATGIKTRTPEHVIALSVSMKLKVLLGEEGFIVIMTRTSNSESIGNIERAKIGNDNKADLVIRVHADSSEESTVRGASILVPGEIGYSKDISEISKKYGQIILNALIEQVEMKNRGIITRTDLTGFNWSKVPVVLVEMGFLSNPDEDTLLSEDSYQQEIALGLAKGIKDALKD